MFSPRLDAAVIKQKLEELLAEEENDESIEKVCDLQESKSNQKGGIRQNRVGQKLSIAGDFPAGKNLDQESKVKQKVPKSRMSRLSAIDNKKHSAQKGVVTK